MSDQILVWTQSKAIGVVTGFDNHTGLYRVLFPDKSELRLKEAHYLNGAWHDFLEDHYQIEHLFGAVTFRKGRDYFLAGNVQKLEYDPRTDTIRGIVRGSRTYTASIRMQTDRSVSMSCSCPVGWSCKHCAATLLQASQLLDFGIVAEPAAAPSQPLPTPLEQALTKIKLSKTVSDAFDAVHSLNDLLAGSDYSAFYGIMLNDLEKMRNEPEKQDTFRLLDIAFAADKRISARMHPILNARSISWARHAVVYRAFSRREISSFPRSMSDTELCIALSFCVGQGVTPTALHLLLTHTTISPEYTDCLFRFFISHSSDDKPVEDILRNLARNNYFVNFTAVRLIHELLSPDCWKSLLRDSAGNLSVTDSFLSTLPVDEQFLLLHNLGNVKEALDYLFGHLRDRVEQYPEEAARAIARLNHRSPAKNDSKRLQKLTEKLPDAEYFQAYIRIGPSFGLEDLEDIPFNFSHLHRYFSFQQTVFEEQNACKISLRCLSPNNTEIFSLFFDENMTSYQETLQFNPYYRYQYLKEKPFAPVADNPFLSAFLPAYLSLYGAPLEEAKKTVLKKIEERRREEIAEEMRRSLASLTGMLYKKKIRLMPSLRASLELNFSTMAAKDGYVAMSLRISNGRGKFYVVKNFQKFLWDCKGQETVEYGKGFAFTHILSNFDDASQKALRVLLRSDYSQDAAYRSDKKYAAVPYAQWNAFLEALQGSRIVWDNTEYEVSLRHFTCDVSLDENNIISIPLDTSSHRLFLSDDILYDFNETENTVDIIDGSDELHRLLMFAFAQNGRSLDPVIQTFKTDIYPRLAQHIRIPETKAEEFRLGQIEINAYFDYAGGTVSVRSEVKKNSAVISPDALSSPGDIAVYDCYQNYLAMLGFSPECPAGASRNRADAWLDDDAGVISFFSMDFSELKKYCNVFLSDSIRNKMLLVFQAPVIRIKYESGIMQAFAENSEYDDEELDGILKAIRMKKKYVLLSGDRIVRLDGADAAEFADTVHDLRLDEKSITEPQQIPVSTSIRALAHEANCRVDDYLVSMIDDIKAFKHSKTPLPDVKADLRSYQKDGFRWLRVLSDYNMGGILADDMGLGKTLEIITLLKSDPAPRPSLVVCPKSLVFNWKTEFERFDPDTPLVEIYGTAAEREKAISEIEDSQKTVYITSYDSLRNDREKYAASFHYLILDEAQYIKNIHAQKSQTVKTLAATHKIALTGTPIENNVLDLWSIFDFILPGYFEDLKEFKHRFETEEHYPEIISRRVAPFILRRTKKDVLKDLPEKYERILSAEMLPAQRKMYAAYQKSAREKIDSGEKAFDILPILTRMRQICVDPAMFVEDYHDGSGKIDLLADLIPEYIAAGHRMLIFSQFVKGLESVEALLRQLHIPYYLLTGDTKSEERIRLVNEFNNSKKVNIFLISLKAGGTGLNLIGADTVIHLDPWWNVAAENQATDRTHRIGQTKNVEVIKLICADSVEQRVIDLQNHKKDLVDKIISNDESSVIGSSIEDISFILG